MSMDGKPSFVILKEEKRNEIREPKLSQLEIDNKEYQSISNKKDIVLCEYEQAPDYLKDNEFIRTGYRLNATTIPKVIRSLFVCNNETVNIWSHLLGTIGVIILIFYTAIFVSAYKESINPYIDYEALLTEIKDVTNPWINTFNLRDDEKDNEMYKAINSLKRITTQFFQDIDDKYDITDKVKNYVDNVRSIIQKAKDKLTLGESGQKFISSLTNKWSEVQKQIVSILQGAGLSFDSGQQISEDGSKIEQLRRWPLFIMLSSAIVCLGCSCIFHWFMALSPKASNVLSRLDYAGITILIAGSCYPPYFYFFYCEVYLCTVYLCFISIFAISVFVFALSPDFHVPRRRRLRGTLFLTLGLSAGIPVVHLILFGNHVSGFNGYDSSPKYYLWVLGGISYVTGALLYLNRIPEKIKPGTFDYCGASHQIFHCLVVLGVVFHYLGSLDAYYFRSENTCPSSI